MLPGFQNENKSIQPTLTSTLQSTGDPSVRFLADVLHVPCIFHLSLNSKAFFFNSRCVENKTDMTHCVKLQILKVELMFVFQNYDCLQYFFFFFDGNGLCFILTICSCYAKYIPSRNDIVSQCNDVRVQFLQNAVFTFKSHFTVELV